MHRQSYIFVFLAILLPLCGCASTQLNFNTVDIAGSVENLYTRQVLVNLSRYADAPNGLPSQIDIQSGTVQTMNSVSSNLSFPVSSTVTNGISGTVSSLTRLIAGAGGGVTGGDTWQQNWNITPLTDANTLRNLRALYRYAVLSSDIRNEYHVPRVRNGDGYVEDLFLIREPQCVLCGKAHAVNGRLKSGWLYWRSDAGPAYSRPPPEGVDVVDLGRFGANELFITRADLDAGVLSDFVLFVLPITEPGVSDPSKQATAVGGRPGASAYRPNFANPPNFGKPPVGIQ